ncbi:hypothetical protein ACQ4M4_11060 [Leptolyngbya sp. AN02str]|uniref:hypothetical protein n=1 Tax=Leptolyngbya sp. AN02str TaxID=3423363 RepID=UPI003D31CE17
MPSLILSFVGQQDPVSDHTHEDGSIVSLMRHLVAEGQTIKQVLLLYTTATKERAELTQGWLMDDPFHLPQERVLFLATGDGLSDDPVNLLLSVQAARQGLEMAIAQATPQDILELNASSGTPVMKSSWSLLQAAGYAPKSRVWQVRNPKEQQSHQMRVFQTNVQVLRQEFDAKVIRQQLQDYNYSGALTTLRMSGLATPLLEALLNYGHCRLSLDFQQAQEAISAGPALSGLCLSGVDSRWQQELEALLQRNPIALMREAYFKAIVELKNKKFSDFLVRVSQFQEKALQFFVNRQLSSRPSLPASFAETSGFWSALSIEHPDLYQFLQGYRFRDVPLRLDGFPNRPTYMAILEYSQDTALEPLQALSSYCDQRNRYIHQFEGISNLEGTEEILRKARQVLCELGQTDFANPYNLLNQDVLRSLHS